MAETVRIDIFIKTVNNKESGIKSAIKNLEEFSDAANHAGGSAEGASNSVTQFDKAAERTQKNLSNWAKEKMEILSEARTPVLDVEALGEQMGIMDIMKAADSLILSAAERLVPYVKEIMDYLLSFMPLIEVALEELMDFVEINLDRLKRKIKEVISGEEWENAALLGKVKIAWDEIIAVPFIDWWNSDGRIMINEAAGGIGNIIGSVLSSGLLLLFGKEASDFIEEGDNVGRSFAAGFAEGFDLEQVGSKFLSGIKNMFSNALKVLPGGESAELSSVISAMIISKIVSSLFGMGIGAAGIGKGVLSKLKPLIGSVTLAPALDGSGMVGGKGLLGALGKAGMGLGSGATTGGGLALAGGAAITGAVMAQATMISGALDVYKAFKSKSKEEATAYGKSAVWKVGGVATGAAAGAAIGSVVPVIGNVAGALIGAGIGGVAGWVQGNKVKEEYKKNVEEMQKEAERAQKIFELTGLSIDNVRFKNEALTEAMKDSGVSAEEFAKMFREACDEVGREAFGDIKLSLAEIKRLAGEITFGDMVEELNKFIQASSEAESAMKSLDLSVKNVKKELWRGGLNIKMSKQDEEGYKDTINHHVETVQSYIEEKHYEATTALQLLEGDDADTQGVDSFYEERQNRVLNIGDNVQEILNHAFEDGKIISEKEEELKEQLELLEEITNSLPGSQSDTQSQAFEIKYKDAAMDYDSFHLMLEELIANEDMLSENVEDAKKVVISNLEAQLAVGNLEEDEYGKKAIKANNNYYSQINEASDRITAFCLDKIAGAFGEEISGFMPNMDGSIGERLKEAMNNAIVANPDVEAWTSNHVIDWLGLDKLGLSEEQQDTIAKEVKQTALVVPDATKETLLQDFLDSVPEVNEIMESLDFTKITYGGWEGVLNRLNPSGMEYPAFAVGDKTQPLAEADAEDYKSACESYATILHNALKNTKDKMEVQDFIKQYMGKGAEVNWEKAMNEVINEGLTLNTEQCRSSAEEAINEAFKSPFDVTAYIRVLPSYIGMKGLTLPNIWGDLLEGDSNEEQPSYAPISGGAEEREKGAFFQVAVQMAPVFQIEEEKDDEKILQKIRKNIKGMADELGGEIAANLEQIYSNMPLAGHQTSYT